jgi:hypothetical protein
VNYPKKTNRYTKDSLKHVPIKNPSLRSCLEFGLYTVPPVRTFDKDR